jgi:uncharacterized membrane protein SpoIIM required for sporulation
MSREDGFVAARRRDWEELEAMLDARAQLHEHDGPSIARVASLYRSLATDLVRARSRRYSPELTAHLDQLASRAHNALYGARPLSVWRLARLLWADFPRALRDNARLFALSTALFVVPFAFGLVGSYDSVEFAERILPTEVLEGMARAYAEGFGGGRSEGQDATMAGFYVYNNVSIAFRCFATGALFGAGSVFFLVYNGLVTGAVAGHVMASGAGANIWTFMCGHAPFELTAIWIAGGAGLELGHAMLVTRGLTRSASLAQVAPGIAAQVSGAAFMLLVAALIEGFWSPSAFAPGAKWAASAAGSALVALWILLGGRRWRASKPGAPRAVER